MTAPRILIATPTDGDPKTASVTHAYHTAVTKLRLAGCGVVPSVLMFSDDLARARSRAVWYALGRDTWDWILWIDDDVAFEDAIVPRMVNAADREGYHVLGAPYPRKRIPAQFPYKPTQETIDAGGFVAVRGCVEVDLLAIGFMLTSRSCLERMVTHYAHEWFTDQHMGGEPREVIALFKQVHTEPVLVNGKRRRELFTEDYSFCWRWRAMGGKVHMYIGPGSPLGHIGPHMFTGAIEELGRL